MDQMKYLNNISHVILFSSTTDDNLFNLINVEKLLLRSDGLSNRGIIYLQNVIDLELCALGGNNLYGNITYDGLKYLINLKVLRLSHHNTLEQFNLNKLKNIKTLILYRCNIVYNELKDVSFNRYINLYDCTYTNNMIYDLTCAKTIKIYGCENMTKDVQRVARNKNIDIRNTARLSFSNLFYFNEEW